MYKYTLAVTSPEYWNTIHNALIVDSNEDGIPDRKIDCSDMKEHSPTRGTYWLTHEEATGISTHPQVKWIELSPSDYRDVYPDPEPDTKKYNQNVKVYRDLGFNPPPTIATSAEENRTNWATKRVGIATNGDSWPNVTGQPAVINSDLSFSLTGKNVDLIIQDSGCLQYHPEFIGNDGKSRVRDVILDGPYYLDPTYFNNNGYTYTKPDGRTGITTTSAHAWWESSGSRSAAFQSLGTWAIPNNYTVANALGIGGTSHTMTSSHGTACASLSGGKNFGLAFEANIWTISIFSPADISTDNSYDAIKILHQYKPINTATGRKNPTVVNGSWGYFGGFNSGTTVNYSFKGSTGSFTGYNSSSTGVQALAQGLQSGQYYNRQYATSSGSNSVDTAGDEMVEAGVIFVTSAGNSNQRLGIGNSDPHLNDYLTSLNGGDSRSGFPSASQSGTKPVGHVKWIHPARNGYDSVNDIYSSIVVGAMDEFIRDDYKEQKASYSNNGPAIDVYAPADETLAAGMRAANGDQLGTETNYSRYNSNFVDRYFNGTSAASPVVAGLVALFLESKPDATSAEVKDFIKGHGSQKLSTTEWRDDTTDDTNPDYWRQLYNNRGAASRVLFDPTASDTRPTFANVIGGESIITDNLVLHLDAADSRSYTGIGTVWYDLSGKDNHFDLYGSPSKIDDVGGAVSFDGTNGSGEFAQGQTTNNSDFKWFTGEYSYGCWARFRTPVNSLSVGTGAMMSSSFQIPGGNNGNGSWTFTYAHNTGGNKVIGHRLEQGAYYYQFYSSTYPPLGTWFYAFFSNKNAGNAEEARLYVNGQVESYTETFGSTTLPAWNYQHNQEFRIASNRNGNEAPVDISNVHVYKGKALNDAEVLFNYNAMKGRFEQKPLILSGISYSLT